MADTERETDKEEEERGKGEKERKAQTPRVCLSKPPKKCCQCHTVVVDSRADSSSVVTLYQWSSALGRDCIHSQLRSNPAITSALHMDKLEHEEANLSEGIYFPKWQKQGQPHCILET